MDREYTLQELRHQYGTGRACHVSGRGKSKVMDYRFGVMTDVGDIELGEWCQMIHALIERAGDQQIYVCLKEVIQQECPWLRTARDIEEETLSFYADQGYLNPQWWRYERFQKMCAAIRDEEIDTSKKV